MSIIEQICTVRAVEKSGSKFSVALEPKKVACPTCDGKCVKMLKPSELIEVETDLDLALDEEIVLYMDKADLRNMVVKVMGLPLLILLATVLLGTHFAIPEFALIAIIFALLAVIFIFQVRYLEFNKQIKLRKLDKSKIRVEK